MRTSHRVLATLMAFILAYAIAEILQRVLIAH